MMAYDYIQLLNLNAVEKKGKIPDATNTENKMSKGDIMRIIKEKRFLQYYDEDFLFDIKNITIIGMQLAKIKIKNTA